MGAWNEELRDLRRVVRLSRDEVASRSGVSAESIRAYETGRRHPTRPTLVAILDTLGLDPVRRNGVLVGAGFAPDRGHMGRLATNPDLTLGEALAECNAWPWPGHVSSEYWEVLGANPLMQRVWDIDTAVEGRDPIGMNLLAALSERRFADRLRNWDDVVRLIVSAVKGGYDDLFAGESTHPYFSAVVERFLGGHEPYVQRFARIWSEVTSEVQRPRFAFPVVWAMPGSNDLCFRVTVNPASTSDYVTFGEWIPTDAATWEALDRLR